MTATSDLALATRDLRKSYGRQMALAGLNLEVPRGVVYGFLGPNGAGKTTTVRLLTGLIRPDGGSIELFGRPFRHSDRKMLFDVGALIESPSFYPHLSGRNNLIVLAAAGKPVPRARIEELLDIVGLVNRADDRVSNYSLGMKQRLGIAVALLNDPQLLLLDEPANGLDPHGIVQLRNTLKALAAGGKTVFVSSHILPEIQQLADIIGIVAAGRLVTQGPLDELLLSQAVIRVRVAPSEIEEAGGVLARLAGAAHVASEDPASGWLAARMPATRSSEVNRALAQAGIYASALEAGSDLESLFLQLTQPPMPVVPPPAPGAVPGWPTRAAR
jgi:ABC-type multidrug transport system ATPase subunit